MQLMASVSGRVQSQAAPRSKPRSGWEIEKVQRAGKDYDDEGHTKYNASRLLLLPEAAVVSWLLVRRPERSPRERTDVERQGEEEARGENTRSSASCRAGRIGKALRCFPPVET